MKRTCNISLNAPPFIRKATIESDNVVKDHRKEAIEILATAHHSDAHDILIKPLLQHIKTLSNLSKALLHSSSVKTE